MAIAFYEKPLSSYVQKAKTALYPPYEASDPRY